MTVASEILGVAHGAAAAIHGGRVIAQWEGERIEIDECVFGRALVLAEDSAAGGVVRVEYSQPDLIFPAAALIFGGKIVEPQDGMRFTVVEPGGTYGDVFEATPNAGGRCFENCDPRGTLVRVHTKKVAA